LVFRWALLWTIALEGGDDRPKILYGCRVDLIYIKPHAWKQYPPLQPARGSLMAIKKLTVSFDLPINTFLSMLAAGNSGLKIDVFGDDHPAKSVRRLNGHAPKLLEGPRRRGRGRDARGNYVNGRNIILKHFSENKGRNIPVREFGPLLMAVGLKPGCSGTIFELKQRGLIKSDGNGGYSITTKGLSEYAKREAANG
jgi:hypothetical protein